MAGLIPNMRAHGWPHLTPGALTPSISPTAGTPTAEVRRSTERWSNGFRYPHVSSGERIGSGESDGAGVHVLMAPKYMLLLLLLSGPNQLYRVPLTDSQQYGWLVTKTEGPEPWTQIKHYPRQNSEMTKYGIL